MGTPGPLQRRSSSSAYRKVYLPDSHFFVPADYPHWQRKESTGSPTSVASIGGTFKKNCLGIHPVGGRALAAIACPHERSFSFRRKWFGRACGPSVRRTSVWDSP